MPLAEADHAALCGRNVQAGVQPDAAVSDVAVDPGGLDFHVERVVAVEAGPEDGSRRRCVGHVDPGCGGKRGHRQVRGVRHCHILPIRSHVEGLTNLAGNKTGRTGGRAVMAAHGVLGVPVEQVIRDEARRARIDRRYGLAGNGIQADLIDEQHTRGPAAFDANRQGRDLAQVRARGGQIDCPGHPASQLQVGGNTTVVDLLAVDLHVELADAGVLGIAEEVQRQGLGIILRPVLSHFERPLGLGIGSGAVVVAERHGLLAGEENRLLGERRRAVTDERAILVYAVPVDPGLEDRGVGLHVIIVALIILDQDGIVCREAPNRTFPHAGRLGLVHLDYFPVVGLVQSQFHLAGGLVDGVRQSQIVNVGPEEDLVGVGFASGPPAQVHERGQTSLAGDRGRTAGIGRNPEETDLAQAVLLEAAAPVAVDRQFHVLGACTREIHGRVGRVGLQTGGLRELEIADRRPGLAIEGGLNRHGLGAPAEGCFKALIGIPDQHFVEPVGLVKFILNPGSGLAHRAEPHVGGRRGVLIRGIQAGTVDRLVGTHGFARFAGRGSRNLVASNRVGHRLHREVPDVACDNRCADFVDTPIVGLAKIEPAGVECGLALALANEFRIGGGSRHDGLARDAEIDVVRLGGLICLPGEHGIVKDIGRAVGRARENRTARRAGHFIAQGIDVNAVVVVIGEVVEGHIGVVCDEGVVQIVGAAAIDLDVDRIGQISVVPAVCLAGDRPVARRAAPRTVVVPRRVGDSRRQIRQGQRNAGPDRRRRAVIDHIIEKLGGIAVALTGGVVAFMGGDAHRGPRIGDGPAVSLLARARIGGRDRRGEPSLKRDAVDRGDRADPEVEGVRVLFGAVDADGGIGPRRGQIHDGKRPRLGRQTHHQCCKNDSRCPRGTLPNGTCLTHDQSSKYPKNKSEKP